MLLQKICSVILIGSVFLCILIAANNSRGLSEVHVICIDSKLEPNDAGIPFVLSKEQLPDYFISISCTHKWDVKLGTLLNQSAKDGLSWKLPDPIPLSLISGIRLKEEDKLLSDDIVEVPMNPKAQPVSMGNYRFTFQTEVSFWVGVEAFFQTPIGRIICTFFIIVCLILLLQYLL